MATYKQIQADVKKHSGFVPKSCWIAHCKELAGLHPKRSPKRRDPTKREVPCPADKQAAIFDAFRRLDMLQ